MNHISEPHQSHHAGLIRQCFLACLLLLSALPAHAAITAQPAGLLQFANASIDRDSADAVPVINNIKACQAVTSTADMKYCEKIVLLCRSSLITTNGACHNAAVQTSVLMTTPTPPALTDITLQFTEQRSQATRDIKLYGYRNQGGGYQSASYAAMNQWQDAVHNGYSSFYIGLAASALRQFPFGGIWKARLKMSLYVVTDNSRLDWEADITLKITDNNNMQIYLPQLTGNTPTVDLNLQRRAGSGSDAQIGGNAHIDTCLYDGFNSNSTRFTLKASNPEGSEFAVKNPIEDIKTPNRSKISYQVLVSMPGSNGAGTVSLQPGVAKNFSLPTTTNVSLVQLPNIAGSVLCVPWGIDLKTEVFKQSDKIAGAYNGKLNITFSPSTNQLP